MLPQLFKQLEDRMKKAVETTRGEFSAVRTGRASIGLLDHVVVEAYGTEMPLRHLASVSVPDSRSLLVQPHDKSILGDVRKAIEKSDLGISPQVDAGGVRLAIPPLTEERRKDLVKVVHKRAEEGRVAVRNIRRDGHDALKTALKDSTITEDDNRRAMEQVQKLTDKAIGDIDALVGSKEKEILEV
ncbi:MAG: ribosome recycling factor [Candidatus Eremiobacteraeota bacterium]|nr:ribosome recycling factor [Candidatus Eremiobacteraeota bacterium]MBC5826304.1 ribosome recycling factor [Candidatus Eremiobacteraeota bacterium]